MKEKENIFNLPNLLATIRLLLVPVVIYLILNDSMIWAFFFFLIACLTDLLDGYIARKYNKITRLGTWLDPFADKMMACSVIVCFTVQGILPTFVVIIIFIKEFLLLTGGLVIIRKGESTPANKFGKMASFILNLAIASGFFYEYLDPYYLWATYFALVCTILSFIQYAIKNWHYVEDIKDDIKR